MVEDYDRIESAVLMARFTEYDDWNCRERDRVARYLEFLLEDPQQHRDHPAGGYAGRGERRGEALAAPDRRGARNIAEGQALGVITAQQDNRLLAAMVLGAVRAAAASELSESTGVDPRRWQTRSGSSWAPASAWRNRNEQQHKR